MGGGVAAILGLAGGAALAIAGAWALARGARALPAAIAGVAIVYCAAWPAFAFSVGASVAGLPGASVGVVTGAAVAATFLSAVIASGVEGGPQMRGVRAFAVAAAASAAVLIGVAYDGQVTAVEGGMMLLGAGAVSWQLAQARGLFAAAAIEGDGRAPSKVLAVGWGLAGLAVVGVGVWLAMLAINALTVSRPDGDLMLGLTVLGLGAALPGLVWTIQARRRGEGQQSLLKICAGMALGMMGGLGCAALVHPVYVSDTFLRAPAMAIAASAVVLLVIAFSKLRAPRFAVGLGVLIYAGFTAAFLGAFG